MLTMSTISWGSDVSNSSLSPVSVSAQNSHGYLLSAGGDIHSYNSPTMWDHISLPFTAPTVFLSAGYDGSMLAIVDSNQAYLLNHSGWGSVSSSALCGAVGDNNSYIICENDYSMQIVRYGSGSTVYTPGKLKQITTTVGSAHVWALDEYGNVHSWDGSMWNSVGTDQMKQIHISLSASNSLQACGVDAAGSGWVYDFTSSSWTSVSNPVSGAQFISLEAGNNFIWATLSTGQVYRGSF